MAVAAAAAAAAVAAVKVSAYREDVRPDRQSVELQCMSSFSQQKTFQC